MVGTYATVDGSLNDAEVQKKKMQQKLWSHLGPHSHQSGSVALQSTRVLKNR